MIAPQIVESTGINLNSLVNVAIKDIKDRNMKTLGIVASPTTLESSLYSFDEITVIKPIIIELNELEVMIRGVVSGVDPDTYQIFLETIIRRMLDMGAEAVLLGCTELELIMKSDRRDALIKPLEPTVINALSSHA